LGSTLRFVISTLLARSFGRGFPWGTLAVNLGGALLIGLLWGFSEKWSFSRETEIFLFIGILGGFTTFSTFAIENFDYFRQGEASIAIINILASNLGGLLLVYAGYLLAHLLLNLAR